jgi:hypothetical protein
VASDQEKNKRRVELAASDTSQNRMVLTMALFNS